MTTNEYQYVGNVDNIIIDIDYANDSQKYVLAIFWHFAYDFYVTIHTLDHIQDSGNHS